MNVEGIAIFAPDNLFTLMKFVGNDRKREIGKTGGDPRGPRPAPQADDSWPYNILILQINL